MYRPLHPGGFPAKNRKSPNHCAVERSEPEENPAVAEWRSEGASRGPKRSSGGISRQIFTLIAGVSLEVFRGSRWYGGQKIKFEQKVLVNASIDLVVGLPQHPVAS
jgi:hypothetical protein